MPIWCQSVGAWSNRLRPGAEPPRLPGLMPRHLPSRAEILAIFKERRELTVEEAATALSQPKTSEQGLLRMLDDLVLSGELEADDRARFAWPGTRKPEPLNLTAAERPPAERDERIRSKPQAPKEAQRGGRQERGERESADRRGGAAQNHGKKGLPPSRKERRGDAARRHEEPKPSSLPVATPLATPLSTPLATQSGTGRRPDGPVRVASGDEREGNLSIAARGFGFVSGIGPAGEDVYIPKEAILGGMHGDRVKVLVAKRSARGFEGAVTEVVERKARRVAGTLRRRGKSAWLEPDDTRMRSPIPLASDLDTRGAEGNSGNDGDAVVISITRYPELPDELPEGKLEAVLGRPGELTVEVAKILVREQIEEVHSEKAFKEAEAYGLEVPKEMLEGREDLTHLPLPTIDPEDARDHDDAVWVERTPRGGYRAYIAIADVSSYVVPGTKIDAEALLRGCSIYLPDRAIPMLPRPLSSNLCSLLPDVIRLCLCVDAEIDAAGNVVRSRLVRGFMKSQAKLSYGSVARALGLSDAPPRNEKAEALVPGLTVALELSKILRQRRMKRGALDLDLPEAKIVLGEDGNPTAIGRRADDQGVRKAYQLIEELMLLANEVVARFFQEKNIPTVYRVHAPPDGEKLDRFAGVCELFGVPFDAEDAQDPKKLSQLLKDLEDHPQANVLRMLLLRSLKQATYDIANIGHFGLASKAYLHFTSPIRRYPDLLVHRSTHAVVQGKRRPPSDDEKLAEAARVSSENERRAMEIEREVVDIYRCVFMRDRIGERYEGTVTALVGTGAYVQLDDPFVDIMLRFEDTGERYEIDEAGLTAVAERSRDVIRLGERVLVEIVDCVITRRTVYGKRVGVESKGAKKKDRVFDKGRDKSKNHRDRSARGASPAPATGKSERSGKKGKKKGK